MSSASQEQPSQSPAKGQQQQQQQPPPEQVAQALEAVQAARRFQDVADALKKQASLATDPAEREKLWRAAYIKEKEAHGESRKARSQFFVLFSSSLRRNTERQKREDERLTGTNLILV